MIILGALLLALVVIGAIVVITALRSGVQLTPPFVLFDSRAKLCASDRFMRLIASFNRLIGGVRPSAVTIGFTIYTWEDWGTRFTRERWYELIRHEETHVIQRVREGRLFLLKYIAAYIKHGYADNPYEVEADERARTQL